MSEVFYATFEMWPFGYSFMTMDIIVEAMTPKDLGPRTSDLGHKIYFGSGTVAQLGRIEVAATDLPGRVVGEEGRELRVNERGRF